MEGVICLKSTNLPTSFLECQRCGGFILSETSTAKRIHNVKCLSSLVESNKDKGCNSEIFQGYVKQTFPFAFVKVPKLSQEQIASARLALRSKETIAKKRRGRPPGTGNRNGLDIKNSIIGERRISRICSKPETDSLKAVISEDREEGKAKSNNEEMPILTRMSPELKTHDGFKQETIKKRRGRPPGTKKWIGLDIKNYIIRERRISRICSKPENDSLKAITPENREAEIAESNDEEMPILTRMTPEVKTNDGFKQETGIKKRRGRPPGTKKWNAVEATKIAKMGQKRISSIANLEKARAKYKLMRYKNRTKGEAAKMKFDQVTTIITARKHAQGKIYEKASDRLKKNVKKRQGGKHSMGIDVTNIIEDTKRSRTASLKAKEKFKDISGEDTTDEMDALTAAGRMPKKRKGRHRKYPGRGTVELTGREKYLLYNKRISLETIRATNGRIGAKKYDKSRDKRTAYSSTELYNRYMRKVICAFCNEYVKAFYLEMHVAHFHTEDHDQQNCDCILLHCKPVDKSKVPSAKEKCVKCGKMITRGAMKEHLALHDRPNRIRMHCKKKMKCDLCNSDFATQTGLKTHFVAVHMQNSPYRCRFTGCTFKAGDYNHLERHVAVHLKENRIKCKWCGKLFTKTDSLYTHVAICPQVGKESVVTTSKPKITKLFEGSLKVKRVEAKDFLTSDSTSPVESDVKTESVFEMESIHLYDKIIETENGPAHVKGEQLNAYPEACRNKSVSNSLNSTAGSTEMSSSSNRSVIDEEEWDEAKIRETVNKKILSWDDKLQDIGYVNDLIRQDPVFQKIEAENGEFANRILRQDSSARRNFFVVNKSASDSVHRCDVCFRAFRLPWGLLNHKKQNVCHFMTTKETSSDNTEHVALEAGSTECTISAASKSQEPKDVADSIYFVCSTCGFQTKSVTGLQHHMKKTMTCADTLTAAERMPKKCQGRKRKYPGRGISELTGREKYLLYCKRRNLETNRRGLTSNELYNRYMRKVKCTFCNEYVKAFYLEMHVAHFHTEDHDQQNCDCVLSHCEPVNKNKVEESKRKQKISAQNRAVKEKCLKCGKMITRGSMKEHLALHGRPNRIRMHREKKMKCAICQSGFVSHHGLKTHFVSVHMQNSPFACKFAGCQFKAGDYFRLERHVAVHLKENRIKCKWCGKLFTKPDSLYTHVATCPQVGKESVATSALRIPNQVKRFRESLRVKRMETKDFSVNDSPLESNLKTESVFETESIHLYDKIIETENGPVHVKGEHLNAYPEAPKTMHESGSLNAAAVSAKGCFINKSVIDGEAENDDKEWDEAKIRETVHKKILSWDHKIQDIGYVNDLIKQDPVFQKIEAENDEFAKMILRHGSGRRNYFVVNRSAPELVHRCENCFRAFRRSWALLNHKKQNVCRFMTNKSTYSDDKERETTGSSDYTTSAVPHDSTGVTNSTDSMNFMCSACGFQSKSAAELEHHMKTTPLHNKKWWKDRTHKCPKKCGAWFSSVQRLNEHIDNVHLKEPKAKCSQCSKAFANKTLLARHVYYVHNYNKQPSFLCEKCGKRFKVKENHEKHVKECTIELRRPKCRQCNEHFGTEHSLQRHVRTMHLNGGMSNAAHYTPDRSLHNDLASVINETVDTNSTEPSNDGEKDNNDSLILGF